MNNILVGIPVLFGPEHTKLAIESVQNEAEVVMVDNGASWEVKQLIAGYSHTIIRNQTNVFVNKSWNTILEYFLEGDWDTLIIMNSDLIMVPGWSWKLQSGISCIPTGGSHKEDTIVTEGTPGVFIHLSREMAKIVYPLPDYIKIWFGDLFIYRVLRELGYKTVVRAGLLANHYNGGSQSVNIVPDKDKIIEQDKINWEKFGEDSIKERISIYKNG